MRRIDLLTVILVAGIALPSFSQTLNDSLKFADQVWAMKKKAIVLAYMDMTEAEKSSFWPVYDQYSNATRYVEIETVYLLSYYAKNFQTLSPNELESLSRKILRNDVMLAKLRRQYFRKFKRALSSEQATAFMQLDNTFRSLIRMDMQKDSPPMELLEGTLLSKASLNQ